MVLWRRSEGWRVFGQVSDWSVSRRAGEGIGELESDALGADEAMRQR